MTVYVLVQNNDLTLLLVTFLFLLLLFLLVVFQPYKSPIHNTMNVCLLFIFIILLVSGIGNLLAYKTGALFAYSAIQQLTGVSIGISFVIPFLFFIALLLYKCFGHRRCTKRVCQRICALMPCGVCSAVAHSGSEESLADRIVNAEQYTPLLSEPFTESAESDGSYD